MKRLLTVQDISCVGKCSLTVALPIISAFGIEACPLPTAVLSTHTAFEHYTFKDLTEEIPAIEDVWALENLRFDTITSGYLGSVRQVDLVRDICHRFGKENALRIVDPAMADGGVLYKGFTQEFVEAMKGLCGEADVIVPNLTEGCLLTGMEYREDGDEEYWKELAVRLSGLGCPNVVLTGFSAKGEIGALSYSRDQGIFRSYVNERLPVQYHGTGDIFASVLAGALTLGRTLSEAQQLAVDFTLESMRATQRDPDRVFYGVNFEEALPGLIEHISGHRA